MPNVDNILDFRSRTPWRPPVGLVLPLKERPYRQVEEKQKRIEFLEKKVQTKDEVLAELMAEYVALKKTLGEL